MLQSLIRKNKGQNTAEYALLIALVVAGVIAMQTYAQRALQARMRDASQFMTTSTGTIGNSSQYEPYYLSSNYQISRNSDETVREGQGLQAKDTSSNRTRADGGSQVSTYDTTQVNGGL